MPAPTLFTLRLPTVGEFFPLLFNSGIVFVTIVTSLGSFLAHEPVMPVDSAALHFVKLVHGGLP